MKTLGFFFFLFVGALGVGLILTKFGNSYQGTLGTLCLAPLWGGIFLVVALLCIRPEKKPYQMARKPKNRKW